MIRTLKIRVYPTKKQEETFEQYFGYSRYTFNRFLDMWNKMYSNGEKPNFRSVRDKYKSTIKEEIESGVNTWLKEYSMQIVDTSGEDVERAWKNFFNPRMNSKKPKYKSKKKQKYTFRLYRKNDSNFKLIDKNHIHLVKVAPKKDGGLRFKEKDTFNKLDNGVIKQVTISKRGGKYFASLAIDFDETISATYNCEHIGIDLGIKNFAILSNGETRDNPAFHRLETLYTRVSIYQRILSRKKYASNRYNTTRTKLQKTYLDIFNIQHDFIQKLTTEIISKYQYIGIEGLNVTGMIKNRRLSKKISRSLFYAFRETLYYKSKWHGNILIEADQFYASSQICSDCGNRKFNDDKLTLSDRTYRCYNCGLVIDRDINAAKNLENLTYS